MKLLHERFSRFKQQTDLGPMSRFQAIKGRFHHGRSDVKMKLRNMDSERKRSGRFKKWLS